MTKPIKTVLIYSPYILGCIFKQFRETNVACIISRVCATITDIFENIVSVLQVWTVPGTQNPDETSPQKQHKRQPAVVRDAPNLDSMEKKVLKTTATPTRLAFNYVHKITLLQETQLVRPACDHKVVLTHLYTVLFLFHVTCVIRSKCIPHHHGYESADIALLHDHLPQ